MSLKKSKFAATETLQANNLANLRDPERKKQAQYTASVLASVLAEVADAIIRGEVTHLTLGMPVNRSALLLTLNWADKSQLRAGGVDLDNLAEQAGQVFLDTGG